jgi:hypothetical protein
MPPHFLIGVIIIMSVWGKKKLFPILSLENRLLCGYLGAPDQSHIIMETPKTLFAEQLDEENGYKHDV